MRRDHVSRRYARKVTGGQEQSPIDNTLRDSVSTGSKVNIQAMNDVGGDSIRTPRQVRQGRVEEAQLLLSDPVGASIESLV